MKDLNRVPPGQAVTAKFPVMTYGATPRFNPQTWSFRLFGEVEKPVELTYPQFMELPKSTEIADFHCVTQWSRLDNHWEGVRIQEIMKLVVLKPTAHFVLAHCDGGYTTNLTMDALLDDDVLMAYKVDGQNLTPDHGRPLRLIVPKLYAWKSAKWLRGLEFLPKDKQGFWENHGYHNEADPWKEQRFSDE